MTALSRLLVVFVELWPFRHAYLVSLDSHDQQAYHLPLLVFENDAPMSREHDGSTMSTDCDRRPLQ